jgi:hypothetical protein
MGIFAKVNSSKAELFEPYNDVEKAGSILGIIINIIGLFWSLFVHGVFSVSHIDR